MNKLSHIPFLLLCILLLSSFCFSSVFAESDIWDGSTADGFDSGSGTKDDPYIIKSAEQLSLLSSSVSAGDGFGGKYIRLDADIALNGTGDLLWTENAKKWTPIGNPNTAFDGFFDGNGHTVSGAYIDSAGNSVGLFGVIGKNGKVSSLTVADSDISGNHSSGGIAGVNNGTISHCRNNGAVRGESETGGIAGTNNGTISNCSNSGWIGNKGNDGGIAGLNCGIIENCYNIGTVDGGYSAAGGITAENRGSIKKCYNTGLIISEYGLSGSIVGVSDGGNVGDCYYLDGYTPDKFGAKLTESQMQTQASFAGFDFDKVWTMGKGEYLHPTLREYSEPEDTSEPVSVPDETSSEPLPIESETKEPEQKESYSLWVLLSILGILAIAKAIVWYVNKKK